jgi:hypothetical protein
VVSLLFTNINSFKQPLQVVFKGDISLLVWKWLNDIPISRDISLNYVNTIVVIASLIKGRETGQRKWKNWQACNVFSSYILCNVVYISVIGVHLLQN